MLTLTLVTSASGPSATAPQGAGGAAADVGQFSIAIASMLAGNLLALLQNNVKRILAYSSIVHIWGYLLVAFQVGGPMGASAAIFYLVADFVMILGAFGVVTVLSERERDADLLEDYRGLFWRRPALALVFTVMLLSPVSLASSTSLRRAPPWEPGRSF